MISFDDLTPNDAKLFKEIVDAMLLMDVDPQIKEGIKYIDEYARKSGKDFYEMMLNLYAMSEIRDAIKKWEVDKWQMKKK
jgi:hypothetical protein